MYPNFSDEMNITRSQTLRPLFSLFPFQYSSKRKQSSHIYPSPKFQWKFLKTIPIDSQKVDEFGLFVHFSRYSCLGNTSVPFHASEISAEIRDSDHGRFPKGARILGTVGAENDIENPAGLAAGSWRDRTKRAAAVPVTNLTGNFESKQTQRKCPRGSARPVHRETRFTIHHRQAFTAPLILEGGGIIQGSEGVALWRNVTAVAHLHPLSCSNNAARSLFACNW